MTSDFKGFRHGVKELRCESSAALITFLGNQFESNILNSGLAPLDLIELGAVYVNDQRSLNPSQTVKENDLVRVHTSPRRYARPARLNEAIQSETNEILIVEKPASLPTDAQVDNFRENLVSFIEDLRRTRLFLCNQLNTEDAGLVLLAKTLATHDDIKAKFATGRIARRFAVYTEQDLAGVEFPETMQLVSCEKRVGETDIIAELSTVWRLTGKRLEAVYRSVIELTEGRPMDVRVHLKAMSSPVLGDKQGASVLSVHNQVTGKSVVALRVIDFILN